jgi:hypothetical protein
MPLLFVYGMGAKLVNPPIQRMSQEKRTSSSTRTTQILFITQNVSSFDDTKLREAFQDRVAELISNVRGGHHVVATLMVESSKNLELLFAKTMH